MVSRSQNSLVLTILKFLLLSIKINYFRAIKAKQAFSVLIYPMLPSEL